MTSSEITSERKTDRHRVFSYLSIVSPERKYVYIATPKVANTTVKMALNQLEGNNDPDYVGNIHKQGMHLSDFSVEENVEMLTSSEWFRFTFVRNPYDRLLSAYKSKIGIWGGEPYYAKMQDEIRETFDYPTHPKGYTPVIAFRDFVNYLIKNWERRRVGCDPHFNLQTNLLMLSHVDYDLIGRFESFVKDFQEILTRLNAPDGIKEIALNNYNPTIQVHHAIAYDRELADVVYNLYQSDFEAFGFEKDSWMYDTYSPYVKDWQQT